MPTLMKEILEKAAQLEALSNEPATKFGEIFISGPQCIVCGNDIEDSNNRTCSDECAEIHAYDISEAEATGN